MKKVFPALLIALTFVICNWTWVGAYSIDGDVSDWGIDLNQAIDSGYLDTHLPSHATVDHVTEDNTDINEGWCKVNPGWSYNNNYDAEAIYFDNDSVYGYIAIISGVGPNSTWKAGDIGIDISGDTATLVDQDSSASGGSASTTPYEYGISLQDTDSDNIPDKGTLKSANSWYNVHYDDPNSYNFTASDPWAISSGNDINDCLLAYSSTPINGHYVIETSFLLSDLGLSPGDEFNIHWTMGCGNDFLTLRAKVDPVPEPGTIMLVGAGLLGLALGSRKKKA